MTEMLEYPKYEGERHFNISQWDTNCTVYSTEWHYN